MAPEALTADRRDMQTMLPNQTSPPAPPDGDSSGTGTLWVGATGVAMLLAAAGVLTAVRWGDIGETAKLAGLVAITLSMLYGGDRVRAMIPLTGRAIFHLGALLIPFDMAAIAILADRTWQETLLLTSFTAIVSLYALARVDPSPVLRWAAHGSVVLGAGGIAAMTPIAAPLALTVVALAGAGAAWWVGRTGGKPVTLGGPTLWAMTAGLAPLAAFSAWPERLASILDELGIVSADRWQLVVAAAIATAAAALLAESRPSLERGWVAVTLAAATAITAALSVDASYATHACLAALFLAAEFALFAIRDDADWRPFAAMTGPLVEGTGALLTVITLVDAVVREDRGEPVSMLILAAAFIGLGWLTADRRRIVEPNDWMVSAIYGGDWIPATVLVPAAALTLGLSIDHSVAAASIALLAAGAWAVLTGRTHGQWAAATTAWMAILLQEPGLEGVLVIGGAMALMTLAATLRLQAGDRASALALSIGAALGGLAILEPLDFVVGAPALPIVAAAGWALSWAISPRIEVLASHAGRALSVILLAAMWTAEPWPALATALIVAGGAGIDAWRTRAPVFLAVGALAVALATVPAGLLVGFTMAETGILMAGLSMIGVGLLIALPQRFELPLGVGALTVALLGVQMAAETGGTLAPALMLGGGALVLFGAATRAVTIIGAGGLLVIAGTWLQLALWEVTWLEAYLTLPTLVALWAGHRWHQNGASSWITYAPTIGIYGFIALADRFDGGSAWHAVIAAAVGIAAVIAGAGWRLIGPLLTGTALLAVAAIHESLGPGSRVPTWGWLALGGAVLLGAAVELERRDTTPLEQGQRLVKVLATRYS